MLLIEASRVKIRQSSVRKVELKKLLSQSICYYEITAFFPMILGYQLIDFHALVSVCMMSLFLRKGNSLWRQQRNRLMAESPSSSSSVFPTFFQNPC